MNDGFKNASDMLDDEGHVKTSTAPKGTSITPEWIEKFRSAKNEVEWNRLCDSLKAEYGGYPRDWYPMVIASGVMMEAQARWPVRVEATASAHGGLAQLGERLLCKQNVTSSILVSSTPLTHTEEIKP